MGNIIFCFSGTGNSLAVARDIAKLLGDTEIVLIADALKEERIDLNYERVGIVCPAYFGSLPPIVGKFAEKLDFSKTQYVFAAITAAAIHGSSFDSLASIIAEHGGHLNAAFPVQLPGSYIVMYGAWPDWLQNYMFKRADKKIVDIVQSVKEKRTTRSNTEKGKDSTPLTERMSDFGHFAKDFQVTDKCTACEICVKICPTRNITMENGTPHFGNNCEQCVACIQWCPVKAIEYKTVTENRKQYRHPNIKAADLFPKT